MRIGLSTNTRSCEWEMQDEMEKWLINRKLLYIREHSVKIIHRIADFIIIKQKKLINIEAKSNDFECMLKQLEDHALYCDYSFAFIPDWCITPSWFEVELGKSKFGLIIYNTSNKIITEVLEAHYNKPPHKELRKKQGLLIKHKYQKQINIEDNNAERHEK